jgi:MSHA pilin protein MshA
MNKNIKSAAQGGFTLIELIVVIVILGILAATALPKFASLGGDARFASLSAAKGALSSTSAMAHGKYLVNTGAPLTTLNVEGATLAFATAPATGYPKADAGLVAAAGLTDEYKVYIGTTANTANNVSVAADEVMLVPSSIASTSSGLNCYVKFKEAADKGQAPSIKIEGSASACE